MHHFLALRPHSWVLGLVTVAVAATLNERIGVVGGLANVVARVERREAELGWKAFFVFGIVGGGLLFALLSGDVGRAGRFGWLGDAWYTGPVLLAAGILIGYGAKDAGGCTSGNGLGGCSAGSPAGIVSTATFMATAVGLSFLLRWAF